MEFVNGYGSHVFPLPVHRESLQPTGLVPAPPPQQYRSVGRPLCTPLQSPGQDRQSSPPQISHTSLPQTGPAAQSGSLPDEQPAGQQPSAGPHAGGVKTHPVDELQLSAVQGLLSLHVIGVFEQTPLLHESLVQRLPSLQLMGVKTHPVEVLQLSVVQALPSLQVIGVFTQPVEELQLSDVQALPSLQLIAVLEHCPLEQVSVVQALPSLQSALVVHWGEDEHPAA